MTKVYVVQHVHEFENDTEDVKLIGVYSSRENAESAVNRLSQVDGFKDTPDGFDIDEYEVDQDNWTEGFLTVAI